MTSRSAGRHAVTLARGSSLERKMGDLADLVDNSAVRGSAHELLRSLKRQAEEKGVSLKDTELSIVFRARIAHPGLNQPLEQNVEIR